MLSSVVALLDPRRHVQAVGDFVRLLAGRFELIQALTRRELAETYAGRLIGTVWAFGQPLISIAIYLVVFNFIFQIRVGGTSDQPLDYATFLLAGLVPWLASAEALNKSVTSITRSSGFVKQIVFPVEVLPIKTLAVVLLSHLVTLSVLFGYILVRHGFLPWTCALLPVALVLQYGFLLGLAYALSATGVYFRDLNEIVEVFTRIGLFVSPIFYNPESLPEAFRFVLYLNPFSYIVWVFQDIFFYGRFEHPWAWAVLAVLMIVSLSLGYRLFRFVRPWFGDVL